MIHPMISATSQAVAGAVRAEVARRQISQRELAVQLGMSRSSLNRRIRGEQAWDTDELHRVAELLKVDVRDLLPTAVATP